MRGYRPWIGAAAPIRRSPSRSVGPLPKQSLLFIDVECHGADHVRAPEIVVLQIHRNGSLIEKYRTHLELASECGREPDAIRHALVAYRKSDAAHVRSEHDTHGQRNLPAQIRRDLHRLELGRIDESFTFPGA